jgi:hypothetical protein
VADQVSNRVPKAVRGAPLDTDDGVEVPTQQSVGPGNREGGGEWPDPDAPARPPAPGALDADRQPEPPASSDPAVDRLVRRALTLAQDEAETDDAARELLSASGGDVELLAAAERVLTEGADAPSGAELGRAARYLAAARSA